VLESLGLGYDARPSGFKLVRLGNGYQVVTRERYAPWVKEMLAGRQKTRLSRAALETAAVVAYKQPITRLEVERIRGVDAGGVLNTLLERSLIMIKGRDPGPGRPLLYGTTQTFLDYFGLEKLNDLPRMEEIAALAKAERGGDWNEDELARFERHGVDAPPAEEEAAAGEPDAVEAEAAAGDVDSGAQDEDREEFREVLAGMSEATGAEGDDTPFTQDPGDDRYDDLEPSEDPGESAHPGS
jgi:segregation and condensation protein B